jgi:hypothetical protein
MPRFSSSASLDFPRLLIFRVTQNLEPSQGFVRHAFTTGHFSHLFVSTPQTAGVGEDNLKIFLDSVGVAGLV